MVTFRFLLASSIKWRLGLGLRSNPRHEGRDDLLQAGLLEVHLQLRSVRREHLAVAEFLMVHALADPEAGLAGTGGEKLCLALDDRA